EELVDRPLELLRYKPERRFVGRVLDSHGRGVVLRCYDDDGFAQATRAAAALSRAGLMTGLLATVAHRRVALWEWIPGRTGAELLRSGEAGRAGELCAQALADIPTSAAGLEARYTPAAIGAHVRAAARDLAWLDP